MMVALVLGLSCLSARADTIASELLFDINSIGIQAKTGTGDNGFQGLYHTGSLVISSGPKSALQLSIDGQPLPGLNRLPVTVTGEIHLVNGVVDHGSVTIASQADTYSFQLQPDPGVALHRIGTTSSYLLAGLTFSGLFSGPSFAGADVGLWYSQQPVLGSFVQFFFKPNSTGFDRATNLDVAAYATPVPLPSAVKGGVTLLGLLGGMVYLRRRAKMAE
jgi:hypothetical protein